MEMAFMCKKCKKAFRKDMSTYEESDEYCPHCDNHYVIDAKTPQAAIGIEGEDARVDSRYAIILPMFFRQQILLNEVLVVTQVAERRSREG
ncbi:hypothetical protein EW146_g10520 [Bondarzewia mesenterica]|uniref:Zinc finger protein n=1 Tax=Bondarzewia mesenterica TaxID=1095465 RepID=A0A4S4KWM3_9AGAM|nr:hypothetical protein EW146_g10520 [Bondarzewia mesenterica]